jgi:hypothetical protein
MVADTMVMLDLLQEAGDEAVTLDELGVAGVHDPAAALLELELAGLEIQRVLVRSDRPDRPIECIRLAEPEPEPEPEQPTVELAAVMPRAALAPPSGRDPGARVAGLVVLTLLLALVAIIARRG